MIQREGGTSAIETLTFREPRLVILILLVLVIAGASALLSIGRQEDPTITNIFASVTTIYPGADPARVESLASAEIERELRTVPEIEKLESSSATGVSIVQIELQESIAAQRIELVWSEIRDKLVDARRRFPANVLEPEFPSDNDGAYAAIVALVPTHPGVPMSITSRHADALADALRDIPGTRQVDQFGEPSEEVLVQLDPDAAAAGALTAEQVAHSITAADAKVQAGRLRGSRTDILIGVQGEIVALDRLRRIVLREGVDGQLLRLGDVAHVTRSMQQPAASYALVDGRAGILLAAKVNEGLQIDGWIQRVYQALDDFDVRLPASIDAELVFDQSEYTSQRLREVGINMLIGMGLIVGVLVLTLGVRAAMIVALVLPLVSLATLATMNFIALPIHQMSVTGLIVALGLLVDSAIVMTDEVRQRLQAGMARASAVSESVCRLAAPLLASTVTTALAFTPLIQLPGPAGDFIGAIAIAVVIMLFWSLAVALTITPAIAGWLLPGAGARQAGIRSSSAGRWFRRSLDWSVRFPGRSIPLALVLPVLGFASMSTLTAQFFPGVERDQLHI